MLLDEFIAVEFSLFSLVLYVSAHLNPYQFTSDQFSSFHFSSAKLGKVGLVHFFLFHPRSASFHYTVYISSVQSRQWCSICLAQLISVKIR